VPHILNAVGGFLTEIKPEALLQEIRSKLEAVFGKISEAEKSRKGAAESVEPEETETTENEILPEEQLETGKTDMVPIESEQRGADASGEQ